MRMFDFTIEHFDFTQICLDCANIKQNLSGLKFDEVLNIIDFDLNYYCAGCSVRRFEPFHVKIGDVSVNWLCFPNLKRFRFDLHTGCVCKYYNVGYIKPPISICLTCALLPRAYSLNHKHFVSGFTALQRLSKLRSDT